MSSVLYCFYDLDVSPASYDFLVFLQLAELHRIRYGYDRISFIFVPGSQDGFRDDDMPKTTEQRLMMMRNVMIPCCRLLPSRIGTVWLSDRNEVGALLEKANGHVFPRLYSLKRPVADYMWTGITAAYLRGESISLFKEPLEYTEMVESYLRESSISEPRKVITVTVRETDYYKERNTNFSEWGPFLKELPDEKYRVIILPDTARVWSKNSFFDEFEHCQMASIDVLFRVALYRQADLNLAVNNGPVTLGSLTGSPTLILKMASEDPASKPGWLKYILGIEFGDQFPMLKMNYRIAWGPEQKDFLLDQFNSYIDDFAELPSEAVVEHGIQSDRQRKILCDNVWIYIRGRRMVFHANHIAQEDVDSLESLVKHNPHFCEPKQLLGEIAVYAGHFDLALQLFNDCVQMSQHSGDEEMYKASRLMRIEVLAESGNMEEALKEGVELSNAYPEDNEIINKVSSLRGYDML